MQMFFVMQYTRELSTHLQYTTTLPGFQKSLMELGIKLKRNLPGKPVRHTFTLIGLGNAFTGGITMPHTFTGTLWE